MLLVTGQCNEIIVSLCLIIRANRSGLMRKYASNYTKHNNSETLKKLILCSEVKNPRKGDHRKCGNN